MEYNTDKYKAYLGIIIERIIYHAREAVTERDKQRKESDGYYYDSGRVMGFHEVISILQQEAESLKSVGIDLSDTSLYNINPEKDLF